MPAEAISQVPLPPARAAEAPRAEEADGGAFRALLRAARKLVGRKAGRSKGSEGNGEQLAALFRQLDPELRQKLARLQAEDPEEGARLLAALMSREASDQHAAEDKTLNLPPQPPTGDESAGPAKSAQAAGGEGKKSGEDGSSTGTTGKRRAALARSTGGRTDGHGTRQVVAGAEQKHDSPSTTSQRGSAETDGRRAGGPKTAGKADGAKQGGGQRAHRAEVGAGTKEAAGGERGTRPDAGPARDASPVRRRQSGEARRTADGNRRTPRAADGRKTDDGGDARKRPPREARVETPRTPRRGKRTGEARKMRPPTEDRRGSKNETAKPVSTATTKDDTDGAAGSRAHRESSSGRQAGTDRAGSPRQESSAAQGPVSRDRAAARPGRSGRGTAQRGPENADAAARREVRRNVVEQARYLREGSESRMKVNINSTELGRVDVRMRSGEGRIDVQIGVQNSRARAALQGDMADLERALEDLHGGRAQAELHQHGEERSEGRQQHDDGRPGRGADREGGEERGGTAPRTQRGRPRRMPDGKLNFLV
ncbi:MAG: flagellar hook-length control protein FliK [Planctomycetota bacterium]